MAAKPLTYTVTVTPTAVITLCQFLIAVKNRVLLHAIDLQPGGSTGASTPLLFDLGTQDSAGTATGDNAALLKTSPAFAEAIETTVNKSFTAEPTTTTVKYPIRVHQQSSKVWRPPTGRPIVMLGGERWGFRFFSGAAAIPGVYTFFMEE